MSEVLVTLLSSLIILTGFLGIILPIFPGVPLVYAGVLLFALLQHPSELTTTVLVVFGILTLISLLIDWLGRVAGARFGQASKAGQTGGIIGLILGILFSPLGGWSILLLPPIGVVVGELIDRRNHQEALRAGWWTLIGSFVTILLNLTIAGIMLIWFVRAIV